MNEIEKPEKCSEHDCNNKAYAKDKITRDQWKWVCKKHHFQFAYGIDYPRETVRGGIKVKKEQLPKVVPKDYPQIKVDGKTYYQVACKKCETADKYKVYYNAEELRFIVECECGKQTNIQHPQISTKPDIMKDKKEIEELYSFIGYFNDGCFMNQDYRNGIIDALSYVLYNGQKLEKAMKQFKGERK